MDIGELIKLRRKELRMKIEDLSEKTGASTGLISNWENGRRTPSYKYLPKLEEALEINFQDYENPNIFKKSNLNLGDNNTIDASKTEQSPEPIALYANSLEILREQLNIKDQQIDKLLEILKSK